MHAVCWYLHGRHNDGRCRFAYRTGTTTVLSCRTIRNFCQFDEHRSANKDRCTLAHCYNATAAAVLPCTHIHSSQVTMRVGGSITLMNQFAGDTVRNAHKLARPRKRRSADDSAANPSPIGIPPIFTVNNNVDNIIIYKSCIYG